MPKLLAFLPCDRIIVDSNDNTATLMSIIEQLTIQKHPKRNDDESLIVPQVWSAFSMWLRTSEDEGKVYQVRIHSKHPNGTVTEGVVSEPFPIVARTHRAMFRFSGKWVDQPGEDIIVLSIREQGQDAWNELAEYPILIEHAIEEDWMSEQNILPVENAS